MCISIKKNEHQESHLLDNIKVALELFNQEESKATAHII